MSRLSDPGVAHAEMPAPAASFLGPRPNPLPQIRAAAPFTGGRGGEGPGAGQQPHYPVTQSYLGGRHSFSDHLSVCVSHVTTDWKNGLNEGTVDIAPEPLPDGHRYFLSFFKGTVRRSPRPSVWSLKTVRRTSNNCFASER